MEAENIREDSREGREVRKGKAYVPTRLGEVGGLMADFLGYLGIGDRGRI